MSFSFERYVFYEPFAAIIKKVNFPFFAIEFLLCFLVVFLSYAILSNNFGDFFLKI